MCGTRARKFCGLDCKVLHIDAFWRHTWLIVWLWFVFGAAQRSKYWGWTILWSQRTSLQWDSKTGKTQQENSAVVYELLVVLSSTSQFSNSTFSAAAMLWLWGVHRSSLQDMISKFGLEEIIKLWKCSESFWRGISIDVDLCPPLGTEIYFNWEKFP